MVYLQAGLQVGTESALDSSHVLAGGDPRLTILAATGKSKILGHDALVVDNVDTGALELLGELDDIGGLIKGTTLNKTTGPGEDGSNGVGRGLAALLVFTVVASDGAVGGLRLEGLAVRSNESRGHQTEGAEALGDDVGLDIPIVV